jgi:hypothetical protein
MEGKYTGDKDYRGQMGAGRGDDFKPKGMKDEETRGRLMTAVSGSYKKLEPFRRLMHTLVEEYAGSSYGTGTGPRHEIYLNLMNQAVEAYTMSLAANTPRILITTEYEQMRHFATTFEQACNNLMKEIQLEETIRRWVLDAFFCVGIVKVHMADSGQVEIEQDLWMDPGKPFASNVALDNFVFDTGAKKWSEIQWAGDSYRVPFNALKDSNMYDQKVTKELSPTSKFQQEESRLELISRGQVTDPDEYEPMIDLMDIWIPRDGKIYTFAMDHVKRFENRHAPLAEMEWNGPEFGPYHILSFNDVPENIMPSSPAGHLNNLSKLANNIIRKQGKRARSARRIHTYPPASHQDAQAVQRAGDDAWVKVQENGELRDVQIGGVDAENQGFLQGVIQMFDRMAGNLQLQAGLGASAPTARQEQLVARHASKKEAQMQHRVIKGTQGLIRDLGFMLWHDNVRSTPGEYAIEGMKDVIIKADWTPEYREGDFFDYNMDIDVYSMSYKSPKDRIGSIVEVVGLIAQHQESLQASGGRIDLQRLVELYSELTNEPRLKEVITFEGGIDNTQMGNGPQGAGAKPPSTPNESIRHNISSNAEQELGPINGPGPEGAPQEEVPVA